MQTILNALNAWSMELTGEQFTGKELLRGMAYGVLAMYCLWAVLYFLQNILPTLID